MFCYRCSVPCSACLHARVHIASTYATCRMLKAQKAPLTTCNSCICMQFCSEELTNWFGSVDPSTPAHRKGARAFTHQAVSTRSKHVNVGIARVIRAICTEGTATFADVVRAVRTDVGHRPTICILARLPAARVVRSSCANVQVDAEQQKRQRESGSMSPSPAPSPSLVAALQRPRNTKHSFPCCCAVDQLLPINRRFSSCIIGINRKHACMQATPLWVRMRITNNVNERPRYLVQRCAHEIITKSVYSLPTMLPADHHRHHSTPHTAE